MLNEAHSFCGFILHCILAILIFFGGVSLFLLCLPELFLQGLDKLSLFAYFSLIMRDECGHLMIMCGRWLTIDIFSHELCDMVFFLGLHVAASGQTFLQFLILSGLAA